MGLLTGKAIVITGSGRGIGAACAVGCARRGAAVVVNDIDAHEVDEIVAVITASGGEAIPCVADASNWGEAGRLIETCINAHGRIDGLVNNAAIMHTAPMEAFDSTMARKQVDINVMGPFYCTAHAIKRMLQQNSGSIINVTSDGHMGVPNLSVYAATKGAVASMVYSWAMELEGTGVRVNGLAPFGATRMGLPKNAPPEVIAEMRKYVQEPEANSPVVEFLLSDMSIGVNGQILHIDQDELHLYSHPALSLPSAVRANWTAEKIADVFATELRDRQFPCGVFGMKGMPVQLQSGFWKYARDGLS